MYRGQESEAYEIDALARQKIEALGFRKQEGAGDLYYQPGRSDVRINVTAGSCESGIVDYGSCVAEHKLHGDWVPVETIGKSDLAYGKQTFQSIQPPAPTAAPRPPGL